MNARYTRAPASRIGLGALASALLAATATVAPLSAQDAPSFYEPGISPDGSEVAFVSGGDIWTVPAAGGAARLLVAHSAHESRPLYSPDGASLAYSRVVNEERELRVMDWDSGEDRRIAVDLDGDPTWSPDGNWLAYLSETDEFSNVMVIPATGGEPRQVSFVANSNAGSLDWSAKGDYLVYRTSQRTEPGRLVKVDLVPHPPTFDEDEFRKLFNEPDSVKESTDEEESSPSADREAVEAPDSIEIVFEGIRRRGAFVNTDFSVGSVSLSPIGFNKNGRQLYVSQGGQLRVVSIPGEQTLTVSTSVEFVEDFDATKVAAYEQGWGEMRDGFYDSNYHGADWAAVRDQFRPQIEGARTRAEFNRLMNLMLGELNASHLGHSGRTGAPQGGDGASTGKLGLRFDRIAYEDDPRFVVTEVIDLGPADISHEISVGDQLMSVGGVALDGSSDLNILLKDTSGEKVMLGVRTGNGSTRDVELLATSGWIIFTGSRRLVDGTSVRMPGTFIRDLRGQDMELNPRPVDIEVERPAGETYLGRDSQLDQAVETLLQQIGGR